MAKLRIGFSSDFTLDSSEVGIGTTNPTAKLQVVDTLKGDFNITGVSTLRVYGGFAAQKQNVTKDSSIGFSTTGVGTFTQPNERESGFLSLVGEYNTVSDDIIVDEGKIFEVSTTNITGITTLGTQEVYAPDDSVVSVGTLESVSIQSHFSVPDGGINDRPDQPVEGMVRFNDDLNTLEFYNGIEWRQFTVSGASGRGVFGGGQAPGTVQVIDFVNISTLGNAQNFGELTSPKHGMGGVSSTIRGIYGGEGPGAGVTTDIEYVTIASQSNAIDFGDLTAARRNPATMSSSTRGIFAGGVPSGTTIDYIEMATLGQAVTFGTSILSVEYAPGNISNGVRGVIAAGGAPITDLLQFTIASKGNGTNFGEMITGRQSAAGCSNSIRGIIMGGNNPGTPAGITSMEYITISSEGNGTFFGDLSFARHSNLGCATQTRGLSVGGGNSPITNSIEYVTISTLGDSVDFGDLTVSRVHAISVSDSHGGLGGF